MKETEGIVKFIGKFHYGWIICGACLLLHALCTGLAASVFSVLFPYFMDTLKISNTQTSLISTIRCLSSLIAMMTTNWFYKKVSLRLGTSIACLILAASFVMFANSKNLAICYLAAVIMGIAYSYGSMVPIAMILNNWFDDLRSTAIAVAACGSGITTAVGSPLITSLAEQYSLRVVFLLIAALITACALALFAIIRTCPKDKGLTPYRFQGNRNEGLITQGASRQKVRFNTGLSRIERLLFFTAVVMIGCAGPPYLGHLTICYRTSGFSATAAAAALSFLGIAMIIGKFLYGTTSDRFTGYKANYLVFSGFAIGCAITASLKGNSLPPLYLATILNGIGISLGTVGTTIWVGELFSGAEYSLNLQRIQLCYQAGGLAWSAIPGIIADFTGGYRLAYIVFFAMIVLSTIIVQSVYHRHLPLVQPSN